MNLIQLNQENLDFLLNFYTEKKDARNNSIISRLNYFQKDLNNPEKKSLTLMDAFSANDIFFKSNSIQKKMAQHFNNEHQNIAYDYENYLINYYKSFKSCRLVLIAYTYSLKNNLYYPKNDDCINDFACKPMIFNKNDLSTVINLVLQNRDPEKLINGMDQIFNTNNNLSKFKEFSIDEQKNIFNLIKNIGISVNNPKTSSLLNKLEVKIDTLQFMQFNSVAKHCIELNLSLLEYNSDLSKSQIRSCFIFLGNQFKKLLIQHKEKNNEYFLSIMNLSQDTIGSDLLSLDFSFNNFDKKEDIQKLTNYIIHESINLLLKDSLKFKEITMNDSSCFQYIQSLIYYNELKDVIPQKNISNANKKNKI